MNRLAVGFGRGFPRMWLVPITVLTFFLGLAVVGRLSRSVAADLIAWWPVWVGLGISAYLLREAKMGAFRAAGLVPLVALAGVGLFIWGHLAGWALMPSAAQRLVGPAVAGYDAAALTARIEGVIEVRTGSEFLYRVEPVRRGGTVGIPGASEQVVESSISVVLEPPADPGIYSFAGWDLTLSPEPAWTLDLDGSVEADLTGLSVTELTVDGSGEVVLGAATVSTPVTVAGDYRVMIPSGTQARVVGTAAVPADWSLTGDGAVAPGGGGGWVLTVTEGAALTVIER